MPAVTPVTTPLATSTLALELLLLHVPPAVSVLNVVDAVSHIFNVPVIGAGVGFTVVDTFATLVHPPLSAEAV